MQKPGPAEPLWVMLPKGLWLEFPDTWANRCGVMILLRSLRRADGWALVTYEHIAQELGDAERRNVHNFWAEFEACGADLAALLQRRAALFDLADAGAQARAAEAPPVPTIPDMLETVLPSAVAPEPPEVQADASVTALEATLLRGEVSPLAGLEQGLFIYQELSA